ncbi:hypothetical protein Ato02nite_005870 [Paractinoplanes toevensis]|uniref:Uncharacterized protein n=2 Tax=Paractinoplanes toevensis TaxID=571911 RepID=A0A919T3Q6_9ACTN|nr:hypothetical protein Ato02nite_005870 [Actinoplanes toevensis]
MEDLSYEHLDALVDTDPIKLRDIAVSLVAESTKLAEVRRWLATYPPIPDDVSGDPEAMIVARLRRMLGNGSIQ